MNWSLVGIPLQWECTMENIHVMKFGRERYIITIWNDETEIVIMYLSQITEVKQRRAQLVLGWVTGAAGHA